MDDKILLKQVKENPMLLENIDNPSRDIIIAAIKKNGIAIKFIENQDFEMRRIAIESNPLSIEYMDNLEEELQVLAVKLLWNSIKLIKNPSYKVKKEAVSTKGWAIQYVENPEEELCLLAVTEEYDAIKYIENPSEEVQLKAVEKSWNAIKYIKNPSLEVRRKAVIEDEEAIHFCDYDIDEVKVFIGDNIKVVKYLYESIDPDLVVEVLMEKLKNDDFTKEYMKDFLELEILEMDKIGFVYEYGSKKAKKMLVDYKLSK